MATGLPSDLPIAQDPTQKPVDNFPIPENPIAQPFDIIQNQLREKKYDEVVQQGKGDYQVGNVTNSINEIDASTLTNLEYIQNNLIFTPRLVNIVIGPASNSDSDTYDYVTDGTADNVQIQAAIDELDAVGGGVILMREGTYTLAATVTYKSNIHLLGMGSEKTIITCTNSFSVDFFELEQSIAGVYIADIGLNGNYTGGATGAGGIVCNVNGSIQVVIDRCVFENFGQNTLVGNVAGTPDEYKVSSQIVRDSYFSSIQSNAIDSWAVVENCHFSSPGGINKCGKVIGCHFTVSSFDTIITACELVLGCTFNLSGLGASARVVTSPTEVSSCFFYVTDTPNVASVIVDNALVTTNNYFQNAGIAIISSAHGRVIGNRIASCQGHAIRCGDNTVASNNNITDGGNATANTYSGISFLAGTNYSIVSSNYIEATGLKYGIEEASGIGPTIITNNVVLNATTANIFTTHASTDVSHNLTA